MRERYGKIELYIDLEPNIYLAIINYLQTDNSKKISKFIEETVASYLEFLEDGEEES